MQPIQPDGRLTDEQLRLATDITPRSSPRPQASTSPQRGVLPRRSSSLAPLYAAGGLSPSSPGRASLSASASGNHLNSSMSTATSASSINTPNAPIREQVNTTPREPTRALSPLGENEIDTNTRAMLQNGKTAGASTSHGQRTRHGHSRSHSSKSSGEVDRSKSSKPPSQKAMLSKALQKANTAVQLDNASNLEGARQAYHEACELLEQVLSRTTAEDDRRKLEAIRQTYASRIDELDQTPWLDDTDKALPLRPGSEDEFADEPENTFSDQARHRGTGPSHFSPNIRAKEWDASDHRENKLVSSFSGDSNRLQSSFSRQPSRPRVVDNEPLMSHAGSRHDLMHQSTYKPPPVSSRHIRDPSQNSWLDGVGESSGSNSSIHSRTSSLGYRRRYIGALNGNSEVEFDTAMDAAIEAAYDDGFEPADPDDYATRENDDVVAKVLRKVEIARERVRQTERETYGYIGANERQVSMDARMESYLPHDASGGFYNDNSSDEEERMLEEMSRDYDIDTVGNPVEPAEGGLRAPKRASQTAISRTKVSSEPTASQPPPPTGLTKKKSFSNMVSGLAPAVPPPQQSLPELPSVRTGSPAQSVRNRRLSGQNPKQLKIETMALPTSKVYTAREGEQAQSPTKATAAAGLDLVSPLGTKSTSQYDDAATGISGSPSTKQLRNIESSSSLRSFKSKNMSMPSIDDGLDMSPLTPSSNQFSNSRGLYVPTVPTPLTSDFRDGVTDLSLSSGISLFDDSLHRPSTPADPVPDAPAPLEHCPSDVMLRPFWLMRCLFQTLVHTRGGYISTKLFVPRDVWSVKGVKLKGIEDKVSNCDLLTAACLKLAKVDTCDADAVLEEMQSLEGILEQVQAALTRKLGNEVGVQGSSSLFKEASAGTEGETAAAMPRSGSISNKASSFSWRRLRSKSSAVGLGGSYNNRNTISEQQKEAGTIPSLPMTPQPTSRPPRRDISLAHFSGPNATYMSSLARLFDAAQAIGMLCTSPYCVRALTHSLPDQIARQVDDPGLRHADKTQVGLELCTRHAAEFFGFYICRFVLTDMGLLLDKFLKRGSEWALA